MKSIAQGLKEGIKRLRAIFFSIFGEQSGAREASFSLITPHKGYQPETNFALE